MNLTCLAFGVVLAICSLLFLFPKFLTHFSFWKKMDFKERQKVNLKAISHNIALILFIATSILLLAGLWSFFKENLFLWCMIAWIALVIMDVIYLNRSKRFNKTNKGIGKING